LIERTSVLELAAVIAQARLVIANEFGTAAPRRRLCVPDGNLVFGTRY